MDPENHFIKIYQHHGRTYQEMISYEDADHNLRPAIESITSFQDKTVLDLGTGTGRIPILFPETNFIGLDLHRNMLLENQRINFSNLIGLVQADFRNLPFAHPEFDIITAGWALGHFTGWFPSSWKEQASQVLKQAINSLRPGGWIILLETLTTGSFSPAPPTPSLADYYQWLESEWGFLKKEVQTDYQFENLEQSARYAQFFFGQDLANLVRKNHWVRLPEWTGIWFKMN